MIDIILTKKKIKKIFNTPFSLPNYFHTMNQIMAVFSVSIIIKLLLDNPMRSSPPVKIDSINSVTICDLLERYK